MESLVLDTQGTPIPCNPADNKINMPAIPGPSFGTGFPPFVFPNLNIPGLPTPVGFPENILELIDSISLLLPGGKYLSNLNPDLDKHLVSAILKLLDVLTPFLSVYKFILPILNMILCILEVLCALANPFKVVAAISKLFTQCIPEFLALFPIFAIILLILSLIKLIIALVNYIILEIERIVNQLLRNVLLIQKIIARQDTRSVQTALRKIASLLCYIQNLFAILQLIALLIQVMSDILKLSFPIPPCDDSGANASPCCTADVCPAFIKNGLPTASTGVFQYLNQAGLQVTLPSGFPSSFSAIFAAQSAVRQESWQFWDPTLAGTMAFYNITAPVDAPGYTFFPTGQTYNSGTNPTKAPYTINLRFLYNPTAFSYTTAPDNDGYTGTRYIQVNNCIVTETPPLQATGWNGQPIGTANGVLYLQGGQAYEDDGVTKITFNGVQATLNTLIHNPISIEPNTATTGPDNPIIFSDVTYTFTINYPVLMGEALITVGCIPQVSITRATINNTYGPTLTSDDVTALLNALPNINNGSGGAIGCLNTALSSFRTNINTATIATFQAATTACLNQVISDCKNTIGMCVDAGFSATKSTFVESSSLQFTTLPIVVTVTLNDASGANLCDSIPTDTAALIAAKIVPEITFGQISSFVYDGSAFFNANLTSDVAGSGTLQVMYNNDFISTVTITTSTTQPVTVANTELTYQFINTTAVSGVGKPRRDPGDVVRDEEGD